MDFFKHEGQKIAPAAHTCALFYAPINDRRGWQRNGGKLGTKWLVLTRLFRNVSLLARQTRESISNGDRRGLRLTRMEQDQELKIIKYRRIDVSAGWLEILYYIEAIIVVVVRSTWRLDYNKKNVYVGNDNRKVRRRQRERGWWRETSRRNRS